MAIFDQKLWSDIGARLATVMPSKRVDSFALVHGLEGVRLDRVVKGRKGLSVDTIVVICEKLDVSPTWLLLGKGPRSLRAVDDHDFIVELLEGEGIEETGKLRIREKALRILEKKLRDSQEQRHHGDLLHENPGAFGTPPTTRGRTGKN